jgi:hypothetical protein
MCLKGKKNGEKKQTFWLYVNDILQISSVKTLNINKYFSSTNKNINTKYECYVKHERHWQNIRKDAFQMQILWENNGKKWHIFVETCLSKAVGSLFIM